MTRFDHPTEAVAGAGAATSPARRQVSPPHPPSEPAQPPEAQRVPSAQKTVLEQGTLATVLALIAGYVDAYAFLSYHSYASFMSGNTTQTGLQLGQGQLATAGHDLLPLPLFVVGVFVGTMLLHSSRMHPLRWLFGSVAALPAVGMAAGYLGPLPGWFSIVILSLAMGLMNTTVTRVGEQSVSLGYVTGSLNNLAQHLALAVKRMPVPLAQGAWDTHGRRAALLAGVWIAFLIGALLAGAATSRFAAGTMLPPMVILVALAAFNHATSAV